MYFFSSAGLCCLALFECILHSPSAKTPMNPSIIPLHSYLSVFLSFFLPVSLSQAVFVTVCVCVSCLITASRSMPPSWFGDAFVIHPSSTSAVLLSHLANLVLIVSVRSVSIMAVKSSLTQVTLTIILCSQSHANTIMCFSNICISIHFPFS